MRAPLAGPAVLALLSLVGGSGASSAPADAGAVSAAPVKLQPHRAIYDVSLDEAGPATSIGSITGRVVYELMGSACEGYAQNMRFVTETTNSEGQSSLTDLRTSSWEDAPARRMRFSSSTYGNEQLLDQTQGTATKSGASGGSSKPAAPAARVSDQPKAARDALAIEVTKPARKSARIGEPVFFPIDHSVAMIRDAREGRRMFTGNLYDGSEGGEKYYFTAASIGPAAASETLQRFAKEGETSRFAGVRSWPIAIAYFKPEAGHTDQLPMYEMFFRFHDNGITSELVIDHGDYRLKGELKELTLLEQSPCP